MDTEKIYDLAAKWALEQYANGQVSCGTPEERQAAQEAAQAAQVAFMRELYK